jgi:hypothetical protein
VEEEGMAAKFTKKTIIKLAIFIVVGYSITVNIITLLLILLSSYMTIPLFDYFSKPALFLIVFFSGPAGLVSIENFPVYSVLLMAVCFALAYAAIRTSSIIFLTFFVLAWLFGGVFGTMYAA